MTRKPLLIAFLICTFTLAFAFAFKTQPVKASPDDIYVPNDYDTIQKAINAATSGDHIHITGTYHEHITVNKTLNLIGEGEATIDGDNTGTIINVTTNNVIITDLKILNAGSDWTNRDSGIKLLNRDSCVIIGNWIDNSRIGIYMQFSSDIHILENTITNTLEGVLLTYSPSNNIENNTFRNNSPAIFLDGIQSKFNFISTNIISDGNTTLHLQYYASNNTIIDNWAINNTYGIYLTQSQNNTIYHNNFINNTNQAWIGSNSLYNKWDAEWPTGGNHWSNHPSPDNFNGQYQNQAGSDGVCDNPYTVYDTDIDRYPLKGPANIFDVHLDLIIEQVTITSNSTISDFQVNTVQGTMKFNVTGKNGVVGFCRVDVPNTIASAWQNNITVLVDGEPVQIRNWTSGITTYIYFTYQHSERAVTIVPELAPYPALILLMTVTLLLAAKTRKRKIT